MPRGERAPKEGYKHWAGLDAPIRRLITRDELLTLLGRYRLTPEVTEFTLRNWERQGVLPHPELGKHIDGLVRALYPVWAATMIMELRHELNQGKKLRDLVPYMRSSARQAARLGNGGDSSIPRERWLPPPPRIYDTPKLDPDELTSWQRDHLSMAIEMALYFEDAPTEDDPFATVRSRFADWLNTVEDIKLVLTSPNGEEVAIPIDLDGVSSTE